MTGIFIFQAADKKYMVTRTHCLFRLDLLEAALRTERCFSCGWPRLPRLS